ncbi:Proclotting enzyme [Araneus ventricosus]|uniref:CLIP domain-containing serine protease n=1 Tax=Araneus ventricosus TaxID=182803 RepID=A0A4Y2B700_ARAVE|nr:Proclotting enzyme [Araneus ventricosus]
MQLWIFGCVFLLKTVDASSVWHRIARQVIFPRSSSPGGSCTTPTERSGTCIPVLQCRRLVQARNMDLMRKSMCGFEGKAPRVCCPVRDEDDLTMEPEGSLPDIGRGFEQNSTSVPSDSNVTDSSSKPETTQEFNRTIKEGRRRTSIFPSECGRTLVTFRRIVGGQESVIGAWPWMALIYYIRRNRKTAECGGALITTKHIITAAHCIVSSRRGNTMSPRQLLVRLGDHDIESDSEGATPVDFAVRSVIKFDGFDLRTFQNDIAILLLSSSVQFGRNIAPICLPFNVFKEDLSNRNAFTAGWGTISYGGPASSKLREVQLRIWENPQCKVVFRREVPITGANVCAGDGDKDACRGDSGGPLMLAHTDGRFYLIGIVSFGKKCAEPGVPGVYARTSHFLDWIEQQVENTI